MKWAAYTSPEKQAHSSSSSEVPIGSGCDKCYRIGNVLKYRSWESFVRAYRQDSDGVRQRVEIIGLNMDKPGTIKNWPPTTATKSVSFQCEVSRTLRAYDSLQMKRKLNCTRLTQRATQGVPSIQGPSLVTMGANETYYLFKQPHPRPDDDDGYDMTITAKFQYGTTSKLLNEAENCFDSHAHAVFADAATKDSAGPSLTAAICRKLPTL